MDTCRQQKHARKKAISEYSKGTLKRNYTQIPKCAITTIKKNEQHNSKLVKLETR